MLSYYQGSVLNIRFYRTASGREPVSDYILSLGEKEHARIIYDLGQVRDKGLSCNAVRFRHIRGKLWEIKIMLGSGYRIFYCMLNNDNIVLLHAYKKSGQKTPKKEIKLARRRMKEVLS